MYLEIELGFAKLVYLHIDTSCEVFSLQYIRTESVLEMYIYKTGYFFSN